MLNFLRNLGFTKHDIFLLFFLIGVFTVGLVVHYSGLSRDVHFDYSREDAQFEQKIRSSFTSGDSLRLNRIVGTRDSLESLSEKKRLPELLPGTKVNINSAYPADLVRLPGIGEVIAERIISYREQIGKFTDISQLMSIKGIGPKKFEKLRNYITIE